MKPIDQLSDDEWQALVRQALALPDAPDHAVRRALALWRQHGPAPKPTRPALQRWVAVLAFDSWAAVPVAAGMRALPSEVRHLLFAAEGCDIDLRVAPLREGFALSGQLLGPLPAPLLGDATAGRIEITGIRGNGSGSGSDGTAPRSVPLDALGEFRIDGVARGTYVMTLHLGGNEIELPPIDVGPPRAGGP